MEDIRDIVSSRWENFLWLDIRGNHDNLDVLSRNSSNNYFARFSVMDQKGHLRSYVVPLQTRGQKFNFIAVELVYFVRSPARHGPVPHAQHVLLPQ